MSNIIYYINNRPIKLIKNRLTEQLVHGYGRRKGIPNNELEKVAIEKYQENGKGITYVDVIEEFKCSKDKAQRKLKNACIENVRDGKKSSVLFRLDDERTIPQQFFPSSIKATIIENKRNRLIGTTGVSLYQNHNFEKLKARYISELLSLLQNQPLSIHKVHLKLSIDRG